MDMTSMLALSSDMGPDSGKDTSGSDGDVHGIQMLTNMFASIGSNDLAALKEYLDGNGGNINDYVNAIHYLYNVTPQIFSPDTTDKVRQVNPDDVLRPRVRLRRVREQSDGREHEHQRLQRDGRGHLTGRAAVRRCRRPLADQLRRDRRGADRQRRGERFHAVRHGPSRSRRTGLHGSAIDQ